MNVDPVVQDHADLLVQPFQKVLHRFPFLRDHLRDQHAGEDAVLLGDVVLDRHPGALLTAEDDLPLYEKVSDVLEPDPGLVYLDPVLFGDRIDEVRGRYGPGCPALPSPRPAEIVEDKRENLIRIDVGPVAVENAEPVRVSVHGKPDVEAAFLHDA